ncbi:MAG: hypothetical protein QF685_08515 [Verrucomicrobiota bacterium]|jgi:hypothetical protein|nr:hypothetical protein [Verrucomicrobiota bacterium]
MKSIVTFFITLTLTINIIAEEPKGSPTATSAFMKNAQKGGLKLSGAGNLHAGQHGLLLVAENGGSIVAIDTKDTGTFKAIKPMANLGGKVAGALGTTAGKVTINDLKANPETGTVYISVRRSDGVSAILMLDASGKLAALDVDKLNWVRVKLADKLKISRISDLGLAPGRVLAAGQSNDAFRSKIFSIPTPIEHGSLAHIYSTDTYHVAHGRWETKAPIQSFIMTEEEGKPYMVGSFACTPIAKFPLGNLNSGAKVRGTSVLELGSGNRPLDMFTYKSGDKQWLVTHTMRFHKPFAYTPSKYWAARIDMKHIAASEKDRTNKQAHRRDKSQAKDPKGVEVVKELHGAIQVDAYGKQSAVLLRESGNLEIVQLP